MGTTGCPEMSVTTNPRYVTSPKSEISFTPRREPEITRINRASEEVQFKFNVRRSLRPLLFFPLRSFLTLACELRYISSLYNIQLWPVLRLFQSMPLNRTSGCSVTFHSSTNCIHVFWFLNSDYFSVSVLVSNYNEFSCTFERNL
jgi:hypothetical protein